MLGHIGFLILTISDFDELGVKKLPTVKTLQAEYAALLSEMKKAYGQYHAAKKEMQDILTAKAKEEIKTTQIRWL